VPGHTHTGTAAWHSQPQVTPCAMFHAPPQRQPSQLPAVTHSCDSPNSWQKQQVPSYKRTCATPPLSTASVPPHVSSKVRRLLTGSVAALRRLHPARLCLYAARAPRAPLASRSPVEMACRAHVVKLWSGHAQCSTLAGRLDTTLASTCVYVCIARFQVDSKYRTLPCRQQRSWVPHECSLQSRTGQPAPPTTT